MSVQENAVADVRLSRLRASAFALVALASLAIPPSSPAQRLTPLGAKPDWSKIDVFQGTMTRGEFKRLLTEVFAPGGAWRSFIEIGGKQALIARTTNPKTTYTLRFAADGAPPQTPRRFWRPVSALPNAPPSRPLEGVKIALDPGHLGGRWARMEERWFQIGKGKPVIEGDMTLRVAQCLAPKLRAMGATVHLLRNTCEPSTGLRPPDLMRAAKNSFALRDIEPAREFYAGFSDPNRGATLQFESERLFYRVSEIRQRASLVNQVLKPDLVVCLHFNAEAWGDPTDPSLVDGGHLHMIVNGCYSEGELANDDVRCEMLLKLLSATHTEELAASTHVGRNLAAATGLPPYIYSGDNAKRMNEWTWARNLLANRLFPCPVVYCEPYVMNSRQDYMRIQAGDYDGLRNVGGRMRPSIYREYAEAVARGLAAHYAARIPK